MPATLKRVLDVPYNNDRPTSPYSPADRGYNDNRICAECSVVSWSSILSLPEDDVFKSTGHTPLAKIRSLNKTSAELAASSCRVCRMLAHVTPASLDGQPCVIEAYSSGSLLHTYSGARSFVLLRVGPENEWDYFHGPQPHPSLAILESTDPQSECGPRLIQPDAVDYDLIKNIIQHCDRCHHRSCPGSGSTTTVSGLQVIDIQTRTVIEAPKRCRYAALSYVWGSQTGKDASDESLGCPPLVIEDALTVCVSLGVKFLWVDRFVSRCLH